MIENIAIYNAFISGQLHFLLVLHVGCVFIPFIWHSKIMSKRIDKNKKIKELNKFITCFMTAIIVILSLVYVGALSSICILVKKMEWITIIYNLILIVMCIVASIVNIAIFNNKNRINTDIKESNNEQ